MLKIRFNETEINVPDSWKDIALSDYEKWFTHTPTNKMEYVHMIADICKIDAQSLLQSSTQLFDVITEALKFVFDTNFEPATNTRIDGQNYFISVSDKLILGEWIDMEEVLNSESETKISELLAIVCRPAGETYNSSTATERKDLFRKLSCDKALPLIAFFFAQKDRIRSDFEPLFSGSGSSKPISKGYKNFCNKWGWYKTIADLAEDKIHLFDQIVGKTVVEVFGFLLYRIDKSRAEEEQYKFEKQIRK